MAWTLTQAHASNLRQWKPRDTIRTPSALFAELDAEFHFTLDVCAIPENAQCPRYFTPQDNGLWQRWEGVCWCNPPYSDIKPWIRRAYEMRSAGATTVLLLPVRSDVPWWHDYAMQADEIRLVRGRIWYEGRSTQCPHPSAIIVFRGSN